MCAHRFYAKRFPVRPRSLTRIIVPYTPYAYRTVRIPLKFEFRPRTRIRRCTRGCSVQRPAPVLVPGPSIVDTDASGDGASGDCTSRERSCRAAGSGDLDHGEIYRFPGAGFAPRTRAPPGQRSRPVGRGRARGKRGGERPVPRPSAGRPCVLIRCLDYFVNYVRIRPARDRVGPHGAAFRLSAL